MTGFVVRDFGNTTVHTTYQHHCADIRAYLEKKSLHQPHLEKLITNGLKLLGTVISKP